MFITWVCSWEELQFLSFLCAQSGVYPALLAKNTHKKGELSSLLIPEKTHFPDGYNIIPEFSAFPTSSENAKDL